MNSRFIYDEKTSSLYAPDGSFLKVVSCPKAKHWNQLIVESGEDRWRNCQECNEKVIDLDVMDSATAINLAGDQWSSICIHASKSSDRVVFLEDINAVPSIADMSKEAGLLIIKTARSIQDIERASAMGYWPDIREVKYRTRKINSKITIGRNVETGQIVTSGDYRHAFPTIADESNLEEILPFINYYPHYQAIPIAAYFLPKNLPDGTKVIIEDPIEDYVAWTWNQGDAGRAENVHAYISGMKVVIKGNEIRVDDLIG